MSKIRWDPIALELGFKDPQHMWRELYRQIGSIKGLSQRFAVAEGTVYAQLRLHEVPIKKQGGPNYVKVVVTPEMIKEIRSKTIRRYARDNELDVTTLYKALARLGLDGKCNPRKVKPPVAGPGDKGTSSPQSEDSSPQETSKEEKETS